MVRMSDADAVWAESDSGGILHDLFGYFPTLHDARVRELRYDGPGRRLELVVDYQDRPDLGEEASSQDLHVRIRLVWTGVIGVALDHYENWIYGVDFKSLPDGGIRTEFHEGMGLQGWVEAEQFEALLDQADPEEGADLDESRLSIRIS